MKNLFKILSFVLVILSLTLASVGLTTNWDGELVEWATMREAIGQGNHQARGTFSTLNSKPHLFALGAVAGLKGEVTVLDGKMIATEVTCCGNLLPVDEEASQKLQGTYVLGSYVESWKKSSLESPLDAQGLEEQLRTMAASEPWKDAPAFPFLLKGEFKDVKFHVINGACPMHARLNELEIPEEKKPYSGKFESLEGQVVGFFADQAVGVRTHPGTSVHAHIIFRDPKSGQEVTGHLEQFSVDAGASLSLPK